MANLVGVKSLAAALAALALVGPVGSGPALGDERPRNGRILIDDGYGVIASIRPDGSGRRVLVQKDDWPGGAIWSPDKSMVAYGLAGGEGTELHMVASTGEGDRVVYSAVYGWAWSPDGRYLAYGSDTGTTPIDECNGIRVVEVATMEARDAADSLDCRPPTGLEWSPDGAEIAFTVVDDPGEYDSEVDVFKADVETGEVVQLTDALGVDTGPEWSPDGAWILFSSNRDAGTADARTSSEVYRMRSDGSEEVRLTGNLSKPDSGASWSPDGTHIAWSSAAGKPNAEGFFEAVAVHVMRSDGSAVDHVTNWRRMSSSEAQFSPDGRWILFNGSPASAKDHDYALYKSHPDGRRRTRLTRVGTRWHASDW